MTDAVIEYADPISISEAAVTKVKELVEEEGNEELMLRVFVTGGGCAGFQYGFTFDDDVADDDSLITKDGVRFLIDSLSVQYLGGSTVDYTQGLDGSRFIIQNPSATTTCGCGSSFAV